MNPIILDVKNVSYLYENRLALENISIQLQRGEMLGLVGQNGSGKSTLLRLLLGIQPLQTGEVYWFGKELSRFREWSKIGYVSQKANSFSSGFPATVEEVVTMGLTGQLGLFHRYGKQEKERVHTAIETVNLGDYRKQNISELSGGQQQRVFIARALVSNPEVLILDEPTVGVDAQNELFFYDLIQHLNQAHTLSIILVSHDVNVVSKRMDSIACLNHHIFFHGNAEQFEQHVHQSHHH